MGNSLGRLVRVLAYAWAAPATLPGLLLVLLAAAGHGRVTRVAGVLEAHGGWLARLLHLRPLRHLEGMALGHVVIGRDADALRRHRAHERVHVAQYERWGPLFLPAYACSSAWAALRGRHPYLDNRFEREAFARAPEGPADPAGTGARA